MTLYKKERFTKCNDDAHYIHEIKKHWWSKWTLEKINGIPRLYIRPCLDLVPVDEFLKNEINQ